MSCGKGKIWSGRPLNWEERIKARRLLIGPRQKAWVRVLQSECNKLVLQINEYRSNNWDFQRRIICWFYFFENFWYLSFQSNEKDKSQRNIDNEEFQFSSRLFYIHPEYDEIGDARNFDICLIKTSVDENGMHRDLSSNFETIPCLPDALNLKKVL